MLNGMLWLLGCQLVGEVLAESLHLPLPGPVIGMVLLFVVLQVRRPSDESRLVHFSDKLLRHLQLLFVPPGVGVVVYLGAVRDQALPIVGALVLSWLAGLVAVALVVVLLNRRGSAA